MSFSLFEVDGYTLTYIYNI